MKKTLFVRPCHDDVVSYLNYYSKLLLKESNNRGFKTINKEKENATKMIITSVIKKNNPDFIMFNGHRSPTMIGGHQDEILIEKNKNHSFFIL